ncbi:hypothetical protein ACWDOP_21425 [Nocardia sp. NPDC003693]
MNRSAVTTLLATAAIMVAAPAASADIVLSEVPNSVAEKKKNDDPMQTIAPGSGGSSDDINTGTSGGLATTGSTGTGSFGLPNLDKLLFGEFDSLCAVTGSAWTILGETSFGCGNLEKKPGDGF